MISLIYEFYFRFNKVFKNKQISILLSKITYCLFVLKFEFKRFTRKRQQSNMTIERAINIVNSVYKKPDDEIGYTESKRNESRFDLSIVVPVYNYEKFIRSNIESILNQKTKYTYELILIDDGSTDGTNSILADYKELKNVKLIEQKNQGIAGARNTGINEASGKYIMFVDCDDIIHDDMVEVMLNVAYMNDCDIVMSGHNLVKERDDRVYSVLPIVYPGTNLMGYKDEDNILNYAGLPWGKIYKRNLWRNVRFLRGYWYEDTIIQWLIFPQCIKFQYIPKVEYEYRWYEKNFSRVQNSGKDTKCIDRYWMLLDIIEKYKELQLPINSMFYLLLLKHLSGYYYCSLIGLDDQIIEAMFILARNLLMEYKPDNNIQLPYMLRITERALLSGDISLWKLASRFQ